MKNKNKNIFILFFFFSFIFSSDEIDSLKSLTSPRIRSSGIKNVRKYSSLPLSQSHKTQFGVTKNIPNTKNDSDFGSDSSSGSDSYFPSDSDFDFDFDSDNYFNF